MERVLSYGKKEWVGNATLKGKFPRLFSLCVDKDSLLEDCGT